MDSSIEILSSQYLAQNVMGRIFNAGGQRYDVKSFQLNNILTLLLSLQYTYPSPSSTMNPFLPALQCTPFFQPSNAPLSSFSQPHNVVPLIPTQPYNVLFSPNPTMHPYLPALQHGPPSLNPAMCTAYLSTLRCVLPFLPSPTICIHLIFYVLLQNSTSTHDK